MVSGYIQPMLARTATAPFSDPGWLFETKWDGCRAIAVCNGKHSRFYSRNGHSFADRYPRIFRELQQTKKYMILDGEIVAIGADGRSDFQLLQDYAKHPDVMVCFYVFDLLNYDQRDLTAQPLTARKALLKNILPKSNLLRYCDEVTGDGRGFFATVCAKGLEGMIAKRKNSPYLPGHRSPDWLKIKHLLSDEVVIIGYTEPKGARKDFGALLLGRYHNGKLLYAGHTGTGFTDQLIKTLHKKMRPLVIHSPCLKVPDFVAEETTWLKPILVAEVRFTEWTDAGLMRQPVFRGLREDKTVDDLKMAEKEKSNEAVMQY